MIFLKKNKIEQSEIVPGIYKDNNDLYKKALLDLACDPKDKTIIGKSGNGLPYFVFTPYKQGPFYELTNRKNIGIQVFKSPDHLMLSSEIGNTHMMMILEDGKLNVSINTKTIMGIYHPEWYAKKIFAAGLFYFYEQGKEINSFHSEWSSSLKYMSDNFDEFLKNLSKFSKSEYTEKNITQIDYLSPYYKNLIFKAAVSTWTGKTIKQLLNFEPVEIIKIENSADNNKNTNRLKPIIEIGWK